MKLSTFGGQTKIHCPVCDARVDMKELFGLIDTLLPAGMPWQERDWLISLAQSRALQWACTDCFSTGRALRATPARQAYCDYPPYLAFYDVTNSRCTDCGQTFTFTAGEQHLWYEELSFWVQSKPNQCAPCRRERRRKKAIMIELGELIKTHDAKDPTAVARIADLFLQVGNRRRGLEWLGRARNLARRLGHHETLVTQVSERIAVIRASDAATDGSATSRT